MQMIDLLARLKSVRPYGRDRWMARCPAHHDRTPSLSIAHHGGKWLLKCFRGCPADAITAALGLTMADLFDEQPQLHRRTLVDCHRGDPLVEARRRKEERAEIARRKGFALAIWDDARDPRDTPVSLYLAMRGLSLPDDIAGTVIRYHPALRYQVTLVEGVVALFRDIKTNEPVAIHRVFLDAAGQKLDRMMLGPTGDAAIKLDADEEVTVGLHIGEGFESCLAARLFGLRPVWALGSAGAIGRFPILPGIETVSILGEVDAGANRRAALACARRWTRAGREVLVVDPLVGDDLNAVVQEVTR
jgi:hypothetical protein